MLQFSLLLSKTSPAYQNQKNHRDFMPKKLQKRPFELRRIFLGNNSSELRNIYLFFRISQIFQKQFVCKQYLIYYIVVHNDVFKTRVLKEKNTTKTSDRHFEFWQDDPGCVQDRSGYKVSRSSLDLSSNAQCFAIQVVQQSFLYIRASWLASTIFNAAPLFCSAYNTR